MGAILVAVLVGVATGPAIAGQKDEDQVRAALDQYVQAVERENLDQYARVVAHDADMVNFGAFGEPIIGWKALRGVIEGQNAALDSIRIEQSQVVVHVIAPSDAAWATSLWRLHAKAGEGVVDLPVRCTWQLEKREKVWQVVHFHKSIAAR
jgi:uncharacterized protein (TIGR02246 family)